MEPKRSPRNARREVLLPPLLLSGWEWGAVSLNYLFALSHVEKQAHVPESPQPKPKKSPSPPRRGRQRRAAPHGHGAEGVAFRPSAAATARHCACLPACCSGLLCCVPRRDLTTERGLVSRTDGPRSSGNRPGRLPVESRAGRLYELGVRVKGIGVSLGWTEWWGLSRGLACARTQREAVVGIGIDRAFRRRESIDHDCGRAPEKI